VIVSFEISTKLNNFDEEKSVVGLFRNCTEPPLFYILLQTHIQSSIFGFYLYYKD
jgi:hypothetical protein